MMVCAWAYGVGQDVRVSQNARGGAAAAVPPELGVRLGIAGIVKIGVPVPIDVDVPALPEGGRAELVVEAPGLGPQAGTVVASTAVSFDAVPGAPRVFTLPVVLTDVRRPPVVRLRIAGRELLRHTATIDPAQVGGRIVITLSDEPMSLALLHALPGRVVTGSTVPERLPRVWQEYAAVDLLAVRDLDPARLDDAQREALLTWLRLGGRLLVIPHPGFRIPRFLDPVLPAVIGEPRSVGSLAPFAARYRAGLPPGPYVITTLVPRTGAEVIRADGVPVIAAGPVGRGSVTVWGFDPAAPPFAEWPGRLNLWAEAFGPPPVPLVDVAAAARHLPQSMPLEAIVHGEVGIAILVYVAAVYATGRRYPAILGVVLGLMLALSGIGVFTAIAADVRARASALVQVTFIEQAPGTRLARATVVAAVAVPYGGRFQVQAPRGVIAAAVTPAGDLRIEPTASAIMLTGRLRLGEGTRGLYAVGTVPLSASASLVADGKILVADLGPDRLRSAEIRWGGRVYLLGDLPPGPSRHRLVPDQWRRPAEAQGDDRARAWIFRGEGSDTIIDPVAPVLIGELASARTVPAFALVHQPSSRGVSVVMLLVPMTAPNRMGPPK